MSLWVAIIWSGEQAFMRVTGIGALLLVGLGVALMAEGPLPNQESLRRAAHEIKLRNFSAAEQLLGEVLKRDPRSFVGHNLMGLMRLSEGNVAVARQAFEQQLWLSFDEWNVWYRKNTEADMNGRGKEALHLIEEVYDLEDALVVGGRLSSRSCVIPTEYAWPVSPNWLMTSRPW
jgi:hypothetical protein